MTALMACVWLLTGALALQAAAPVVSNVRASQRPGTKFVDIYYDVSDPDSSALSVWILISSDGGVTYNVPASTFTGAVGGGVAPGANKYAQWNAGADWDGQFTSQCRARVIANDADVDGFVNIPAGAFVRGDTFNDGASYERPTNKVYVSAFAIAKTEVTSALWNQVRLWALVRGYAFDNIGLAKGVDHPVHTVNWYDTVKWCNARSQMEGRERCYYTDVGFVTVYQSGQIIPFVKWTANGYRLPTEAEWEKAARGGLTGRRFPWGDTITHNQANYYSQNFFYDTSVTKGYNPNYQTSGLPYTSPVASFPPNGYGLFDMSGNLYEWCWDWFDTQWYENLDSTFDNTRGPSTSPSSQRAARGGSWGGSAFDSRCASRSADNVSTAHYYTGFRCVRGL